MLDVKDAFDGDGGAAAGGGRDPAPGDLLTRLIKLVRQVLGPETAIPEPFPADRQLSDFGVSSLKMLNLMLAVEVEFDIAIPQAEITPENFHSIASMQELVGRLLRG